MKQSRDLGDTLRKITESSAGGRTGHEFNKSSHHNSMVKQSTQQSTLAEESVLIGERSP